jgi:UDP-GlcNAc:undecaprenyl-phosphate GlcNAc-1-phosphate transferase
MQTFSVAKTIPVEASPATWRVTPLARPRAGAPRVLGVPLWAYIPVCGAALLLLTPPAHAFSAAQGLRGAHVLALAFSLSFSLTPAAARLARSLGFLDLPDGRKAHARPTPLLGGAAVTVGFVAALVANGLMAAELAAIIAATLALFAVGVVDDRRGVPAAVKLLVQAGGALLVMASGVLLRTVPPDWGAWTLPLNAVLTLLWIVGITNAMNFFDGMDGLAAGLGAIIAFFLGAVALQSGQAFLGWIAAAMFGGCLGFLPYNFRHRGPALIFLGDAGSTVIGFVLACIAVYGDWAAGRPFVSLLSPVLVFWVLIFDMVHITVDRIVTGKVRSFRQWLDYVGRDHLHHRIADVLGCRRRSVLFIFLMSLCLGASACMLPAADAPGAALLLLQAGIVVVLITVLERQGRRRAAVPAEQPVAPPGGAGRFFDRPAKGFSIAGDEIDSSSALLPRIEGGGRLRSAGGRPSRKTGGDQGEWEHLCSGN